MSTPLGTTLDDLMSSSVTLSRVENRFVWRDPVFEQFPLALDPPPTELSLTIDEGDNSALQITDVRLLLQSYRLRFYHPAGA